MAAKQKVFGPYKVINIGVGGNMYEVVEMLDKEKNQHAELRPRKTYLNRQSAFGKCLRLNRRWQEENIMDDELLDYWKEAAN